MKKTFFEYYKWTESEISNFWKTSLFTFDTNILLDSFKLPQELSDLLFSVLSKIQDRIVLTYQVAFEYHKNINSVLKKELEKYDESLRMLRKLNEDLSSQHRHPYIKNYKKSLKTIEDKLESSKKKFSSKIKEHPNKSKICNIFEKKLLPKFSLEKLNEIYNEGETRYKDKIPPGYNDKDKKPENDKYGDLIIWKEIIEYSSKEKKDIIFITNDKKDDWFKDGSPRIELIREFYEKTSGKNIYIIDLKTFLFESNKFLDSNVGNSKLETLSFAMTSIEEEAEQSSEISDIDNSSSATSTSESLTNTELLETCIEVKKDPINLDGTSTST